MCDSLLIATKQVINRTVTSRAERAPGRSQTISAVRQPADIARTIVTIKLLENGCAASASGALTTSSENAPGNLQYRCKYQGSDDVGE